MSNSRDPLANTDRLIVDGSNLLPALARQRGAVPPAALIGRLRAAVPPAAGIDLVFDGAPDPGLRRERIASGLTVRYAGRLSADEVIVGLVGQTGGMAGGPARDTILVVTDDRALAATVRQLGARTAGTAWLVGRLDRPRLSSPSVGNRRPPASSGQPLSPGQLHSPGQPPSHGQPLPADEEREPWQPGRGATTKRGNPHRRRRSSGSMPS